MDIILKEFAALNEIPRPSGHEEAVAAYLFETAKKRGFWAEQDAANNVIVEMPATDEANTAPLVILQAHMDMVCVGGEGFVPEKDAIVTETDGETMWAKGTSLGADDGIGVAMLLALLKGDFPHGPLRLLFTADEEVGMNGANALAEKYLAGDYLINLDWEDATSLCIGCASCGDGVYTKTMAQKCVQGREIRVEIAHLRGGHSGSEIHEHRANALKIAGELLYALTEAGIPFSLTEIAGGKAMNVIAPNAALGFVVAEKDEDAAYAALHGAIVVVKADFPEEKDLEIRLTSAAAPTYGYLEGDSRDVALFLREFPQGVVSMSKEIPSLVSTSCNLGVISLKDEVLSLVLSFRSDEAPKEKALMRRCRLLAEGFGFHIAKEVYGIPWTPKYDSFLEKIAVDAYKELGFGTLRVETVHAGLECALFAQKNPDLSMISIGPTVEQCHSVAERLYLSTVPMMMQWLLGILQKLQQS